MSQPLFSVVIPTYNRSNLVQGAVRSVIGQSVEDVEIVVSDNCSEDDTRDVIEAFTDPRVRYVRTPKHTPIADSWEFARCQARGRFIMMLSDDDALVHDALARFADAHHRYEADFLFCNLAEYRDTSYPGPLRNTVDCRSFTGTTRVVSTVELLKPLFALTPSFNFHPSAFMFGSKLADQVTRRCGRFFTTNGVEYFAWPLAASFSRNIVYIDAPLVILGRTFKSWGSALVLTNPGKELIDKMIADVEHDREWVPLKNFTSINLIAEGLLFGKRLFPEELAPYPFDEERYLRLTFAELQQRRCLGVDVQREIDELVTYVERHPSVKVDLTIGDGHRSHVSRTLARKLAKYVGVHYALRCVRALREHRRIARGDVQSGFRASGGFLGFGDAVGCAAFISRVTAPVLSKVSVETPPLPPRSSAHLETARLGGSVR